MVIRKRNWFTVLAVSLLVTFCIGTIWAEEKTIPKGKWVIALSNSYYGNTWRKQMVDAFEQAAKMAKTNGYIKDYIIANGDGTQNTQIAQMNSLILKKVDAICINAASPTALNGVIAKANQAGIKVLAFDSIATSPVAYTMDFNFVQYGEAVANYVAKRLNGKGSVIQIRGVSGSAPDKQMYEGQMNVLKNYPDIKVVATVIGEASATVTQKAMANILPSLPKVDAVLTQGGGDAFGAAQAYEASGKAIPIIVGDNSAEFVQWWLKNKKASNYETFGVCSTPGIGGASFWVALNILNKVDVPKKMTLKIFELTQDAVDQYSDMKPGTIVSPNFTNDYVLENIIKPYRK